MKRKKSISCLICIVCVCMIMIVSGCEGSDSKKVVTDTVETLSGAEAIKKGEQIKKQLDEFSKQEAQRAQSGLVENSTGIQPEQLAH